MASSVITLSVHVVPDLGSPYDPIEIPLPGHAQSPFLGVMPGRDAVLWWMGQVQVSNDARACKAVKMFTLWLGRK